MRKYLFTLVKGWIIVNSLVFANVWGISDAEILKGLETLGDWQAAYPLARQLAQQQNTYQAWRDLAVKYTQFDTDKVAYLRTWQQARQLNQVDIYKDFIMLSPDSPLNLLAIEAIFELTRSTDDVQAYRSFMEIFPDSVEALQALLRVHELAFARAQQLNRPEVYDAFIAAFPGAKQTMQAVEQAYQLEKQTLENDLSGKSFQQQKLEELIVSHQQMLDSINKIAMVETAHSVVDAAGRVAAVAPQWLKEVTVKENKENVPRFNWCGTVGKVTGVAVSMVPVASAAQLPTSLAAKMVCEAIPSIVQFFKDFFG